MVKESSIYNLTHQNYYHDQFRKNNLHRFTFRSSNYLDDKNLIINCVIDTTANFFHSRVCREKKIKKI